MATLERFHGKREFEATLRVAIKMSRHTMKEVAELVGMSEPTLFRRIKNPEELSMIELDRICRAMRLNFIDMVAMLKDGRPA